MKKFKIIYYLSLLLLLIVLNLLIFLVPANMGIITAPHDADRKANGNTLVCTTQFGEMLEHIERRREQKPIDPANTVHKVIEVDETGEAIWEISGLAIPHEVEELPNGHLLIADTTFDRVVEVNYPNKDFVWSWEPAKIDWSLVNPSWDSDHYYNNNLSYDWTHINDVDYKDYGSWQACLISLRNFDLVVEVNYTAEKIGPANNPNNIVWWYGDYSNTSLVNKQHNPDYLSNGNIIIADSLNNRIVEINKTTKEIVWEYSNGLKWPRDADELPNGNILITDCFNCRVIEIEKESKETIWKFARGMIIPYESDLLANGNILISGQYSGLVLEVNREGHIVWKYGFSIEKGVAYINFSFFLLASSFAFFFRFQTLKTIGLTRKQRILNYISIVLLALVIILSLFVLIGYSFVMRTITKLVYSKISHKMF
ncbi:MAG: hypothetical protein GF308_01895 [Candidatus Heimdallarchaeota archaeon]|nr:hypothetical protein [Candidatus Heimdallarchaeota archaeon]